MKRKIAQVAVANEADGIAALAVASDGTAWVGCFIGSAHEGKN